MIWTSDLPAVADDGTTLNDLLAVAIERHAGRTALVDGPTGASVTYGELDRRVRRIAGWLARRGVDSDDRIAVISPNLPPVAACILAAWRIGAAVTPANPAATDDELATQLDDAGASVVVTTPGLVERVRAMGHGSAGILVLGDRAVDGATPLARVIAETDSESDSEPVAGRSVPVDPDATALLPYSSGTTGLPKGVVLTDRSLVAVTRQISAAIAADEHDVTLALAPFFHILGMTAELLVPLAAGATVVTVPRFEPATVLALAESHRITYLAVPPPVAGWLATDPAVDEHDLGSLRLLAVGGAPLAAATQRALARRLAGCAVGQGWGLTETSGAVAIPRAGTGSRPGTVGPLLPGTELRVRHPETGADLDPGTDGELWVRGPQLMAGYLHRPVETAAMFDGDGWMRTGDLGRVDEDGNVMIVDRLKELIKVNAFQVAPAEVEAALLAHPDVIDAGVTARADPRTGEVPVAFVVGRHGLDVDDVRAVLRRRLAPYKQPALIELVDALPRTPSGKLLRRRLPVPAPTG